MFTQQVRVHGIDGSTKDTSLDQWSLGQWSIFATKQGLRMDMDKPGLLAIAMLRYQAYAQIHRDSNGSKPSFDTWDRTVAEVEVLEESEPADPTQQAT